MRHADCEHCAELAERVAWLESELGLSQQAGILAKLQEGMVRHPKGGRPQMLDLIAALYAANGRPISRYQLLDRVPSPSEREDRDAKIVDVWVCRARQLIGRDAIGTVWGRGFYMTPAGMAKVDAMLGAAQRAAA